MNKNFCVLPWVHLHSYPHGATAPCCSFDQKQSMGNIKEHTISEIQNSAPINFIRKSMLNDQPVLGCNTCQAMEQAGSKKSPRLEFNNWFKDIVPELVQNTDSNGNLMFPFKQKYLNIRFSNLCNYACRTCGPTHSSLWAQENNETQPVKHILKDISSYKEDVFQHLPYADRINFAGGESLLIAEHWEILDRLIELGRTNVTITYFTNLSKLTYQQKNILDYLAKFPNMKLYASIDASHQRAEIYRHGTVWSTVEQNLKTLYQSGLPYAVWTTVGAMNVWHATDLHKYLIENQLARPDQLKVNNLVDAPWSSTKILPPGIKLEATRKIRDFQQWAESQNHDTSLWDSVISFMNLEDHSHLLDEFISYNKKLDSIRNQSSEEVFPELKEIWYPRTDSNCH